MTAARGRSLNTRSLVPTDYIDCLTALKLRRLPRYCIAQPPRILDWSEKRSYSRVKQSLLVELLGESAALLFSWLPSWERASSHLRLLVIINGARNLVRRWYLIDRKSVVWER